MFEPHTEAMCPALQCFVGCNLPIFIVFTDVYSTSVADWYD